MASLSIKLPNRGNNPLGVKVSPVDISKVDSFPPKKGKFLALLVQGTGNRIIMLNLDKITVEIVYILRLNMWRLSINNDTHTIGTMGPAPNMEFTEYIASEYGRHTLIDLENEEFGNWHMLFPEWD